MYLSGDGKTFGFKHPKINTILENDVKISDEIYNEFFKRQEAGKQFKVKNKNGETFEEIFEEFFEEIN